MSWGQSSGQTSKLGESDWRQFGVDTAIVKAQLSNYEQALKQALDENANIRNELQRANQDLEDYKQGSTQSYPVLLEEVEKLTQQLSESDSMVSELRQSLESKQREYDQRLRAAQDGARALERERDTWRVVAIVAVIVAGGAAVYAAVK